MADTDLRSRQDAAPNAPAAERPRAPGLASRRRSRIRILPVLLTLIVIAAAVWLGRAMWDLYMEAPWTRDGTVRAYVVTIAPEVADQIVKLPVADNQFVHKGQLLMVIDPTDYKIAVDLAEAAVEQAKVTAQNAEREAQRRLELTQLAVTKEEKQTYESTAIGDQAAYQQAVARLAQARVNLERTHIYSPVNGYVTNLLVQLGDYATVGKYLISIVDSDSFWVDGYFEETNIDRIQVGDPATIKLMGYPQILHGHVNSIARAIDVPNAQPNELGVATVNPIFTWVRLAQRIPVRIHIDHVPKGVTLSAGMTATVQINPRARDADGAGGQPPSPSSHD
jgi:multidrug resistance efflux pump